MLLSNLVMILSKWFNRETWLDDYAKPVQSFIRDLFKSSGKAGQQTANLLNGTWIGHPLHSILTDIPIGAWTTAITLDSMEVATGKRGIGKAADAAVALGVAGAAGAALAGIADWQHTKGESRRMGFVHGLLNTVALGLFVSSMIARDGRNRGLGRALALTGFGVITASAYLGGDLVCRLKIGVDHAPEDEEIHAEDFVAVMPADRLPENQPYQAMLKNIPLVLLRRDDTGVSRIYALPATCAHLGGPLPEGKLEEGPTGHPVIVCPWHGSRYDMETGAVLDGPSAYPMPCFEARIRGGQVEVRHQVI